MAKKPPKPTDRPSSPRYKDRKKRTSEPISLLDAIYPTKSTTLSALFREEMSDDDGINTKSPLHLITDRSLALITAAGIERALERAIITHLPKLDVYTFRKLASSEGPLSSLFAKIHLGFALGLLDKRTRDNLDIVRRVRNVFAHAPKAVSFRTIPIAKECRKLKLLSVPPTSDDGPIAAQRFIFACLEAITFVAAQLESAARPAKPSPSPSKS